MALEVGTLISLTFYLKRMTGLVWHSIPWEPLSGRHGRTPYQGNVLMADKQSGVPVNRSDSVGGLCIVVLRQNQEVKWVPSG